MAGGDYALIKSVEGFEDFAPFGRKQIADLGVAPGDVVFAITEGGETSFVIGTAWQGLEAGARIFFVYNNPDDVLRAHVRRSREVIDEPRIEKVNLTTGPMAITGSTRMQATSIELLAMLTVLEMALRDLPRGTRAALAPASAGRRRARGDARRPGGRPRRSCAPRRCASPWPGSCEPKSGSTAPARGRRTSPTRSAWTCSPTPPSAARRSARPSFRKWDDRGRLGVVGVPVHGRAGDRRGVDTPAAAASRRRSSGRTPKLRALLRRRRRRNARARSLREIGRRELLRFRIGLDGLAHRPFRPGDGVTAVVAEPDLALVEDPGGAFAHGLGARARREPRPRSSPSAGAGASTSAAAIAATGERPAGLAAGAGYAVPARPDAARRRPRCS